MQKIISVLYRNIFNRELITIFNRLKTYKGADESLIVEYQRKKLIDVLRLMPSIPFYSNNFVDIDGLNYDRFKSIPVLTKDIIRKEGDNLINLAYSSSSKPYKNSSGGSTGEPVTFYRTREHSLHGGANYYFANYLNGIDVFDNSIELWGAERDMHNIDKAFDLRSFLHNKVILNTFVLSDNIILKYIHIINKNRPKYIKAYVHSIYDIAKYINRNNIKMASRPIIHCTTGPLYPEMRAEIKMAFNDAHVFSFYGSREVSAIATEILAEEGFLVLFDNIFLEILNEYDEPVKKGEEGQVVVTALNNYYMPLIRYKIGDRAVKGDDHEFGTLRIERVVGRTLGVVYTLDGRKVDGQFFTSLFFHKQGIKRFQVVQKSLDSLEVNIVKNASFNQGELDEVLNRIRIELGSIDIQVKFCDSIGLTSTGKIMYVYSEIDTIK